MLASTRKASDVFVRF